MDLDALTTARRDEWRRLDELSKARGLDGAAVDELVARYQSASADLADIKTSAGRTPQGDHVSTMLSRARLRLTGASDNVLRQVPRFFVNQLPAALYQLRWTVLVLVIAFVGIVWGTAAWIVSDPALVATLGDEYQMEQYAEEDFVDYYSDHSEAMFGAMVWSNNAWIAVQSVLFGITGVWPVYVFVQNAVGLGTSAAIMFEYDRGADFVLYILPHGQLEMTSIFVAVAAGLHMFWAWVVPGPRGRLDALASQGRALSTVAIGLVLSLAVSGVVEGWVTRQDWPWVIKIGIGTLALAAFLVYMLVLGRRAHAAGETGDLTEYEAGTPRLVAG
ncbi:stage II sporulation protein M [Microbacterium halophytorum]|uniref:stage II sporulation protein M n=1 Tax=Microbacterium halophytorum TaxID=2067568 RepID=UPI000CFBC0D8|nr:stage II sporulation protein M [Microbacterium halophytorum]